MSSIPKCRLDFIDPAIAELLQGSLERFKEGVAEFQQAIAADSAGITQGSYFRHRRYPLKIALVAYALGHPIAEVRQSLFQAATYYLRLFELRGTTYDIRVTMKQGRQHTEKVTDYGVTSSRDAYEGMCIALSARAFEIAGQIAVRTEDPPKASYIYPDSDICTPNQQRLGYALRNLVTDRIDQVETELARVYIKKQKKEAPIEDQAEMLRGLATGSAG